MLMTLCRNDIPPKFKSIPVKHPNYNKQTNNKKQPGTTTELSEDLKVLLIVKMILHHVSHPKSTNVLHLIRKLSEGLYKVAQVWQVFVPNRRVIWHLDDVALAKCKEMLNSQKRREVKVQLWTACRYCVSYHFLLDTLHAYPKVGLRHLPFRPFSLTVQTLTNRPDFLKPKTPSAKEAQQHLHDFRDSQGLSQKSDH